MPKADYLVYHRKAIQAAKLAVRAERVMSATCVVKMMEL